MNLPPYGIKLYKHLAGGNKLTNDIFLFMGKNAWRKADAHNRNKFVLCLPPDKNPIDYDWPVLNCDVLIFDSDPIDEYLIELLAEQLFSYGANIVRYVSNEDSMTVFKKEL